MGGKKLVKVINERSQVPPPIRPCTIPTYYTAPPSHFSWSLNTMLRKSVALLLNFIVKTVRTAKSWFWRTTQPIIINSWQVITAGRWLLLIVNVSMLCSLDVVPINYLYFCLRAILFSKPEAIRWIFFRMWSEVPPRGVYRSTYLAYSSGSLLTILIHTWVQMAKTTQHLLKIPKKLAFHY